MKVPLVVVTGAGSCVPYGLPDGVGLLKEIKTKVAQGLTRGNHGAVNQVISREDLRELEEALHYMGAKTIDQFLEGASDLVKRAGKFVAALVLLEHERFAAIKRLQPQDDWCSHLWRACDPSSPPPGVAILTFNYDRTLEYRLLARLNARDFHRGQQRPGRLPFEVIHLHGALGPCSGEPGWWRSMTEDCDIEFVQKAASDIAMVGDELADDRFASARGYLEGAERVAILGFGFDERNVRRLGLDRLCRGKVSAVTAFKMAESTRDQAREWFGANTHFCDQGESRCSDALAISGLR